MGNLQKEMDEAFEATHPEYAEHWDDGMFKPRTENCRICDLTYQAGTEHKCTDGWGSKTQHCIGCSGWVSHNPLDEGYACPGI